MIGKSPNERQKRLFMPNLTDFINLRHELCLLAKKIDWQQFETDFAPFYSTVGTPAKPIRLMVGLLILKQIYNLGDETVMSEWVSNPYLPKTVFLRGSSFSMEVSVRPFGCACIFGIGLESKESRRFWR